MQQEQDPPEVGMLLKTPEIHAKDKPQLVHKQLYGKIDYQDEIILRDIIYILNRISVKNYKKLSENLLTLPINNENRLKNLINTLLKMAIFEEIFTGMYAQLCKDLCVIKVSSSDDPKRNIEFRTLLLDKVKNDLETNYIKEIELDALYQVELCSDEKKKLLLSKINEENLIIAKQKTFGNMRFIGELYKIDVIREDEVLFYINMLLKKDNDEVNIERLCVLLRLIGKKLDKPDNMTTMVLLFEKFHNIIDRRICVEPRIRFMVMDLVDLRHNNWEPVARGRLISQIISSQEEIQTLNI